MSQENVELVQALYASWGRGIDEELWDRLAPDFVADFSRRLIEGGVLCGRDTVRAYLGNALEAWEDGYSNEPEKLFDAGDQVVAFVRASGIGRTSGAQVDAHIAHLWTFRKDVAIKFEYFGEDRVAALEAVGLAEQDAHADS